MRILVVEDDPKIGSFVSGGLKQHGFAVDVAKNGDDALALGTVTPYDAAIVDIMLPGLDGLSVVRRLRAKGSHLPVLFLSARSTVDDRISGLEAGGDDYLTKPFAFSELLARIRLLIRRGGTTGNAPQTKLVCDDLEMDLLAHRVRRAGKPIDLQPREYRLLEYLLQHVDQVVTRTMLLEGVWDFHFDPNTNVTDVHISRLRKKIETDVRNPEIIKTVWGGGYTLATEVTRL